MSKRSLGTLTVDLILKMGGFQEGLDKASRETKKRMKEIQTYVDETTKRLKNMVLAGAGIVATASAISIAMVNASRQSIDANAKLARSLDTTYDSLTALQLRAGDAGIDGLEGSLNRLNRRLGAVEMAGGPALKTVEALKLNLAEMANMEIDEKIGYIGDRIRDLGLSNEEAARHLQQLGFEQAVALELFRTGSADIDRYRREVKELGLNVNDLDARRIEQMNDALGIFDDMQQSVATRLTVATAPAVSALAQTIERAWIETDNWGLASAAFQQKFADAMASSLRGAASLLDFLDTRTGGGIASSGLIGLLLFGTKGLFMGGAIGALFSQIRLELAKFGIGADDQSAELFRAEAALEDAREALAALDQRRSLGQNVDREIANQQRRLELWAAKAEEVRATMSEAAWADFNKWFKQDEQSAEGIAYWLREAAAAVQNGLATSDSSFSPNRIGEVETTEIDSEREKTKALYETQAAAMQRQIALYWETSQVAAMRYDTERGALKDLSDEQKANMLQMAESMDWYDELKKHLDQMAEATKARQKQMEEIGLQAGRNMQGILADYLFNPFDKGLKSMARNFTNMLLQMSSQVASAKLLQGLLGGLAGSANPFLAALGSSFGGMKDGGGYVAPGSWAIAGEIGPEIVTGPAMVTSRSATASQLGNGITISIDARDEGAEARIRSMIQQEMLPQIIKAARDNTVAALKRPRFA